jgi:hypothetical protein
LIHDPKTAPQPTSSGRYEGARRSPFALPHQGIAECC